MKTHRPSSYLVLTGIALGLLGGLWWSRGPDRIHSVLPAAHQDTPKGPDGSISRSEDVASGALPAALQPDSRLTRIRELLATLEPVLPGETENKAALELLHWWAEIDAVAAIAYAHDHPAIHGRAELPAELFTTWLETNGESATAWATTLPSGELRARLLPVVIAALAETHPLEALSMAAELDGENRRLALSSVFAEWSSVDPAGAAAEARRLPSAEEQNIALNEVIGKWADRDLDAAIEWAKRLPASGDPGSLDIPVGPLEILMEKWIAQTPIDAAHYLVTLPEGTRRIQMLSTAVGQWAGQNPREALAWATSLAGENDRNVALRGVLAGVAQSDAVAAANLALTLPPGTEQQKGMELIIEQWSARAPETLTRWATEQVSNASRNAALPAIVTAWAGADLPTLGDWLNALPSGDARDTCCAALARYLAPTRRDLAREWAATIADPDLREKTLAGEGNH